MSKARIENCKVISTTLGREDHGILTAFVTVEGDGWGCGFGGYALDDWRQEENRRVGTAYGMEFIASVLRTLEVERWEDLPGKPCRVDTEGIGGRICRIGHYVKDKWFDPRELSARMNR